MTRLKLVKFYVRHVIACSGDGVIWKAITFLRGCLSLFGVASSSRVAVTSLCCVVHSFRVVVTLLCFVVSSLCLVM